MLDKNTVPEVNVVKAVFRTMAHFHGAWTKVLSSKGKIPGAKLSFSEKDLERTFRMPTNNFLMSLWACK